jgi:predicted MPP superfamily phosphohydrolase
VRPVKHNSATRRVLTRAVNACLLDGLLARWSYYAGLQGIMQTTSFSLPISSDLLPRPLVLAFASDFHAGAATHPQIFQTLAGRLEEIRPDVLLLGGDYVCCKAAYIDILCASLSRCRPALGAYAVLGNHDLWSGERYIKERLTAAGVRVLMNENVSLQPPFDAISICGIDDPWTGEPDVRMAFAGAAPVRIFLTHSPDGLLFLDNHQFTVGFAGHTHGGQIALRDGTPIVTAGGPLSRKYGRGRFDLAGPGTLFVSRGVGCSTVPVRINSDPEIVVCTLQP